MPVPPLPNGNSKVSLSVDNVPLSGVVSVQLKPQAPSSLTMVASTPKPDGFSMTQAQVADAFAAMHALAATT